MKWLLACGCWSDDGPRRSVVGPVCPECGEALVQPAVILRGDEDIPPRDDAERTVYVALVEDQPGRIIKSARRGARGTEVSPTYQRYARPEDAAELDWSGGSENDYYIVAWKIVPAPREHWVCVGQNGTSRYIRLKEAK